MRILVTKEIFKTLTKLDTSNLENYPFISMSESTNSLCMLSHLLKSKNRVKLPIVSEFVLFSYDDNMNMIDHIKKEISISRLIKLKKILK
jgi:hypothetical protein